MKKNFIISFIKNLIRYPSTYAVAVCFLCIGSVPAGAQLPQAADNAARAAMESAAREGVTQVPLMGAERALLPANGCATHEIKYNYSAPQITVAPVSSLPSTYERHYSVGGKPVSISGPFMKYVPYFPQLDAKATLRKENFPRLWGENNRILRASLAHSMQRIAAVEKQSALFYSALRSRVFDGDIPYDQYLPFESVDFVYVGELHENPMMQEELLSILQTLQRHYPNRNIYLATEYVWDAADISKGETSALAIVRNKQELLDLIGKRLYVDFFFLHKALKMGIPVVGLEPYVALTKEAAENAGVPLEKAGSYRRILAGSEAGMEMRNQKWVEYIRQIKAQDPNALVVVHAGAQHLSYHNVSSVANKLNGKAFSVMLLDFRRKETNPILAMLEDKISLWREFSEAHNGKYVLSFKEPNPQQGLTSSQLDEFKRSIGADMVVFLQDLSPMIIP